MKPASRLAAGMDEAAFLASDMVQDAVIRNIEILGEATNKVLREVPDFAAVHGHIPWQVLYTMRNRVSHGYDKVDLGIVWNTVRHDLPGLLDQIQGVRASLADG